MDRLFRQNSIGNIGLKRHFRSYGPNRHTVVQSYPRFCFLQFELPKVNHKPKTFNGKIRRTEIRQADIAKYNAEHGTHIM